MASTEKIFIDLNEELVFVLEKINASVAPKIIIVLPKSANVSSSLLSLKVLNRLIAKSNKLVAVVTDDPFGIKLGEKAGLVTLENPGEITPDTWVEIKKRKEEVLEKQERIKYDLLQRRQEKKQADYKIIEEEEEPLPEPKNEKSEDGEKKEEEFVIKKKPRINPKIVNIGEVQFYSAGDILDNEDLVSELIPSDVIEKPIIDDMADEVKSDRMVDLDNFVDEEPTEKKKVEKKSLSNRREKQMVDYSDESVEEKGRFQVKKSAIVGQNLAKVTGFRPGKRSAESAEQSKSNPAKPIVDAITNVFNSPDEDGKKKKAGIAAGIIILIIAVLLLTSGTNVNVKVTLKKDTLAIKETITADPSVQGINAESFKINAVSRSADDDSSETGNATGKGTKGEKAKGRVKIFNSKIGQQVNLKAGTILAIIPSKLKYLLVNDITIPAAETGPGGVPVLKSVDADIVAETHGTNYNAPQTKDFEVQGYPFAEVSATNAAPISGGTSEETSVVSQEDVNSLTDILKTRVESTATQKLESLAATDEIILPNTIAVTITKQTASKKVGEEAEKFDVAVQAKVTALFVKKTDIEALVKEIAKNKQQIEGDSDINIGQFPDISDVKFDKGIATFTITSEANARPKVTKEDIEDNMNGKNVADAEKYLKDNPNIETYEITSGPWYMPGFLRTVNVDKLTVRVNNK